MAIDLDADLAAFFQTDDFAVTAAYQIEGGASGTITGIFNNPSSVSELGEAGFLASAPTFTAPTADVPGEFGEGDQLTISGTVYKVAFEPEANTSGVSVITLELDT